MYNVILRCVCGTIVAMEQLEVLHNTEFVFVTIGIQHAVYVLQIANCCLPGCIFPHYLINGMVY